MKILKEIIKIGENQSATPPRYYYDLRLSSEVSVYF